MTNPDPTHNQPRKDPFLDEVHALKRAAFTRSGDDLDKHIKHLQELDRQNADRLIQPPSDSETDAA
jgi:hypothetical protein